MWLSNVPWNAGTAGNGSVLRWDPMLYSVVHTLHYGWELSRQYDVSIVLVGWMDGRIKYAAKALQSRGIKFFISGSPWKCEVASIYYNDVLFEDEAYYMRVVRGKGYWLHGGCPLVVVHYWKLHIQTEWITIKLELLPISIEILFLQKAPAWFFVGLVWNENVYGSSKQQAIARSIPSMRRPKGITKIRAGYSTGK